MVQFPKLMLTTATRASSGSLSVTPTTVKVTSSREHAAPEPRYLGGLAALWHRLFVELNCKGRERRVFCYDSWLKCCRRPLSLAFVCPDSASGWVILQSLLQPYSNQTFSLSVDFTGQSYALDNMFGDFLALEELFMRFDPSTTCMDDLHQPIAQSISQLPSILHSLSILEPVFKLDQLSSFNPTWAYLKNVTITLYEDDVAHGLLRLAPNLSTLNIAVYFFTDETLESFTHTKLQSFHISCQFPHLKPKLSGLLNALSLPNLRVLGVYDAKLWPHEAFKMFLVWSNCPLESLVFNHDITTDEQQAEYLSLVPSLRSDHQRERGRVYTSNALVITESVPLSYTRKREIHSIGVNFMQMNDGRDVMRQFSDPNEAVQASALSPALRTCALNMLMHAKKVSCLSLLAELALAAPLQSPRRTGIPTTIPFTSTAHGAGQPLTGGLGGARTLGILRAEAPLDLWSKLKTGLIIASMQEDLDGYGSNKTSFPSIHFTRPEIKNDNREEDEEDGDSGEDFAGLFSSEYTTDENTQKDPTRPRPLYIQMVTSESIELLSSGE
ncbi:hypothetical protein F4604DRAFT_2044459 [Suillus subluteus]|nr:hypothetical protein F4604DRAFT_2044459 [Suillus subluteus]